MLTDQTIKNVALRKAKTQIPNIPNITKFPLIYLVPDIRNGGFCES